MTWRYAEINVATTGGGPGEPPGGALELDFAASTIAPAALTSAARYYRNTSKVLVEAAANAPRFHCGTDGLVKGILLERASTGWLKRNHEFGTANGWTHKDVTVVSGLRPDIFGSTAAYEFEEAATTTTHNINRTLGAVPADIPDDTALCLWAIVEYVDMEYVMLQFRDKLNNFPWQRFNIKPDNAAVHTAFAGTGIQYSAGIEYLGSNRHLIWAAFDTQSDVAAVDPTFFLQGVNAAGDSHSYLGTGRSFIVHATGVNTGTYPQMFFPTADAAVAKVADVLTLDAEDQEANDFYVEIAFIERDVSLLVGTPPDRVMYKAGDFSVRRTATGITAGKAGAELSGVNTFVPGSRYVVAVGKGPTQGLQIVVNGTELAADASAAFLAAITPGQPFIGSDENGANHLDCVIESFEMGAWE